MKPDQGSDRREKSEGQPYGFGLDALDEGGVFGTRSRATLFPDCHSGCRLPLSLPDCPRKTRFGLPSGSRLLPAGPGENPLRPSMAVPTPMIVAAPRRK